MKRYIFYSFLLVLFTALDIPLSYGDVSNPVFYKKVSREEIIKRIAKDYPIDKWKTVGFCDGDKKPLMHLKVPSFLEWDKECGAYHKKKNGIVYCGPTFSSPRLSGILKFEDTEVRLEIGMEAGEHKKPSKFHNDFNIFYDWKEYGALQDKKAVYLDGFESYLGEIEDKNGSLPKPTKIMTLIYYAFPYIGGSLYFVETRKNEDGVFFTPHSERVFQDVIDKVIGTFKFQVKVEDEKNKAYFKHLERKK